MISSDSAARNGHDRSPGAVDLSSVFGAAAAVLARRRSRARRPRRAREPDPVETETMEDDVPDTTRRQAPAAPGAPAPRRRFGVVKVRDRQHVDMLLLAAATKGPANGHQLIDLVRERSDGLFELSLSTVIRELHRLANNRLMRVVEDGRVRRYSLTPLGERVLATRRREWEAFSHGLNSVLDAADGPDGRRDAGRERPAQAE